MTMQKVILRAIDGRVKWYQAAESLGISHVRSVHSADFTDQSETSTGSTPRVFNRSIRKAKISCTLQADFTSVITGTCQKDGGFDFS